MKFLLCLFVACAFAVTLQQAEFKNYVSMNGKSYSEAEYRYRFSVYQKNVAKIQEHNAKNLPWTEGVNKFTDLTADEFAGKFCGCAKPAKTNGQKASILPQSNAEAIDWREQGAVSPVKNQAACGSCWAFSTTGTLETSYYLKNKKMETFSEQQLVDCTTDLNNHGCSGGWPARTMPYVKSHGLCTEEDYPYLGVDGTCKEDCKVAIKINDFIELESSEKALASGVTYGAVSTVLDATVLQSYKSGIVTECSENINHAVLTVGFGVENDTKYWIIKNSWGEDWGEKGFFRIQKDTATFNGLCGCAYSNVMATELA